MVVTSGLFAFWMGGIVVNLRQAVLGSIQVCTSLALSSALVGCPNSSEDPVATAMPVACQMAQAQSVPAAPAPGAPPAGINLARQPINTVLSSPVFVTAPPGDTSRLFVIEQAGIVKIFDRATNALIGTFLDISSLVLCCGERGLLGMAFDPNYATNGRFFVSYTAQPDGRSVIARYRVSGNPDVAMNTPDRIILETAQPFSNHNGGMIAFGPADGLLYIGLGDGGSGNDPGNRAQNAGELLGKMLRIDVSQGAVNQPAYLVPSNNPCAGVSGARPEIWSIGLRNPWRYSFDRQSGDLYVADVGQGTLEEVNVSTVSAGAGRGTNYGWRVKEGTTCTNLGPGSCTNPDLQDPAVEYAHSGGACSVTGGYVYRGTAIPALQGTYFYADYCAGFVRSFRYVNGTVTDHANWTSLGGGNISSFGEDGAGELYIVTLGGGLFRIVQN
jgi:glucose/arabinose dehydrogenase